MNFWDGVLISTFAWTLIYILAITSISVWNNINVIGWSQGFSDGWDSAVKTTMKLLRREGRDEEVAMIQDGMK